MGVLGGNDEKDGVSREVGFLNNDVRKHSVLFRVDQWGTKREDNPIKGASPRRSNFPLLVLIVCGRSISHAEKGGKGRVHKGDCSQ